MPYADPATQQRRNRESYLRNIEKVKARTRERYAKNIISCRDQIKAWKAAHPENVAAQRARARIAKGLHPSPHSQHVKCWKNQPRPSLHDAHVRAFKSDDGVYYAWRYHNDSDFALKERLRRQFRKKSEVVPGMAELIRTALKSGGESAKVESVLGYSIAQLRVHLERQFAKGMSWSSAGVNGWHIDHILPRKCFDLASIEGIQAYWSLSNLRPLPAKDNLRKGSKVETLL